MIGILAGMGPKSTAPFVDKVVQLCQEMYGAKHDADFPPMMIYSCPTPFYLDRPLDHMALEASIISGAQKLAATGVDFIVIPCNTAHRYFDNIKNSVEVPILNIVDEAAKSIPAGKNKVTLLSTPSTFEAGIYQNRLSSLGCDFVWNESWQPLINQIILSVKENGALSQAFSLWQTLLDEIGEQVDTILLACTDLTIVANQQLSNHSIIDTGHCLAQAAVKRYYFAQPNFSQKHSY
jgi:aspartate racemase